MSSASPTAWKRLESARLRDDLEGTRFEILQRVVSLAGLELEFPSPEIRKAADWRAELERVRRHGGRTRLLETIDWALPKGLQMILEGTRLRVVDRDSAEKYWSAWWAAEKAKR